MNARSAFEILSRDALAESVEPQERLDHLGAITVLASELKLPAAATAAQKAAKALQALDTHQLRLLDLLAGEQGSTVGGAACLHSAG